MISYPFNYKNIITKTAAQNDVSPSLIASVINAESHFKKEAISSVGAMGLMQLMPSTAKFIAQKCNIDYTSLIYPESNISLGTAYIRYLLEKFPDTKTMLCAYNAGEGNVARWLKDSRYSLDQKTLISTPFPATNYYADKVLHDEKIYRKFFG
ncbi:MAG: lytic transglycosylase domain-containing protein [Clostridia bacterium]|nr:lytic transglycosylase domain-containing protein [Clostridia bacterium]